MTDDLVAALGHLTLGTRLKRLGDRLQGETTRFLRAQGVDVPSGWFPMLAALETSGGRTVGELAAELGVSQPGVTRSVGVLAERGLVEVTEGRADRRRRTVVLTASGVRLVARAREELWPHIDEAVRQACDGLTGPFLDEVAGLERRLDEAGVDVRAARLAGERS
ncbi:MarR family transcriptional regulator [Agromyces sp. G08B096]|uniref:MarR family transcriptional regulator n=1 Tax=Agromyces sp. G08B096 TaxID=3156399 RepID=A0AAU7W8S2_9MICO